jgi:hypothetical protein
MSHAKRRQILAIVATDRTFERATLRDQEVWVGKCLHCNSRLTVTAAGEPMLQERRRARWREPEGE